MSDPQTVIVFALLALAGGDLLRVLYRSIKLKKGSCATGGCAGCSFNHVSQEPCGDEKTFVQLEVRGQGIVK